MRHDRHREDEPLFQSPSNVQGKRSRSSRKFTNRYRAVRSVPDKCFYFNFFFKFSLTPCGITSLISYDLLHLLPPISCLSRTVHRLMCGSLVPVQKSFRAQISLYRISRSLTCHSLTIVLKPDARDNYPVVAYSAL